jgi:hypothetical protein
MRRERDETTPKIYGRMMRLAGHKLAIISLLIPFGLVIFVTAANENFILQNTGGSNESYEKVWVLQYAGIAAMVCGIVWIILVLIARRSITKGSLFRRH